MAKLEKTPMSHDITRVGDDGELYTTTESLGYFREVVFTDEEVANMNSTDVALARRVLYVAGMDIGAVDEHDSPAVRDAVFAACEKYNIHGPGFPVGLVLQGAEFGRSLLVAADKLSGFSFDEWLARAKDSTEADASQATS